MSTFQISWTALDFLHHRRRSRRRSFHVDDADIKLEMKQLSLAQCYEENKLLLAAVILNDVVDLRQRVLPPSTWFDTDESYGLTPLQVAIEEDSKEAFLYLLSKLLSFPGFYLEITNYAEETALGFALSKLCSRGPKAAGDDYYVWKLIEAGADIFHCSVNGCTTLSWVALIHHIKMAKHFIENGVDVNRQDDVGDTALHYAVKFAGPDCIEFVTLLIENGADASIRNNAGLVAFEMAVLDCKDSLLHEILFYYTYDKYTEMRIQFRVLMRLAMHRSPVLQYFDYVDEDDSCFAWYDVDVEFFKLLVEKFRSHADIIFKSISPTPEGITFEHLQVLLDSDLKTDLISINKECTEYMLKRDLDVAHMITFSNIYYYSLSYGLELNECSMQLIYNKFGYCEFFKILLHMDIHSNGQWYYFGQKEIMPALLYDVSLDLENYLQNPYQFSTQNVDCLLHYFVNPRLNARCYELYGDKINARIMNLPQVPSLLELARNSFRKYFIGTFQIKTSRQFYTLINCMKISNEYKKIIAFEKKLYNFQH